MNRAKKGFTIVELLIVIVVIAILAGLSTAVYSGITQRADNTARIAAAEQWAQLIKMYVAATGNVPPSIDALVVGSQKLCLGTGFPVGGGGVPRCQNVKGTDANSPAESDNAQLMAELKTIGELPSSKPSPTSPGLTGPWLSKPVSGNMVNVTVALDGVFASGEECGGGFKGGWADSRVSTCTKTIVF